MSTGVLRDGQQGSGEDWQLVVQAFRRGYLELNDGRVVLHGPIHSVRMGLGGNFVIELKWAARVATGPGGLPRGEWEVESMPTVVIPTFFGYVVEDTPEKGLRVRFAEISLLYLDAESGLDPARVKGLVLPPAEAPAQTATNEATIASSDGDKSSV